MESIDNLTQDQNNFLSQINNIYENTVGYESYGDTIEFYDEDGVVLMTCTNISDGKILFTFTENNDNYEYELNDVKEFEDNFPDLS